MRISGPLQGGLIALGTAFALRNTPATAEPKWWPYVLFGYAFIGAVLPSLIAGVEFQPRMTLVLGVFGALPFWTAARWLDGSPYGALAIGCWLMVGLWGIHALLSVAAWLRYRISTRPQ